MESEEGNSSLDILAIAARQASRQEPLLPTSSTGGSQVQLLQFLHTLNEPDLPYLSLITPVRFQRQKCEKCPSEFLSPVNYRRHFLMHRRSPKKETLTDRGLLAAFWNRLSLKDAKEILSFNDVMLKEIPGSSVLEALTYVLHGNAFFALPRFYVDAGSILLDVVQAKRLPITSEDLFSVLEDATESTFFDGGTDEFIQKYVFDGETSRNSLELKNIIASIAFLFELQLVKAWVAHKEAEALRCQKLLVEEEEAAQKKQANLLVKKRQRKHRQKKQKLKERSNGDNVDLGNNIDALNPPPLAEGSAVTSTSDSNLISQDVPENLDSLSELQLESERDIGAQFDLCNQGESGTIEPQIMGTHGYQQLNSDICHSKSKRRRRHRKPEGQNRTFKPEGQIRETFKPEPKDGTLHGGSRILVKKLKINRNTKGSKTPPLQVEETSKQKLKERSNGNNNIVDLDNKTDALDPPPLAEGSAVPSTSHSNLSNLQVPENLDSLSEPLQLESERHIEEQFDLSNQGESGTIEPYIMDTDCLSQLNSLSLSWHSKKKRGNRQCRTFKPEGENHPSSTPEVKNHPTSKPEVQNRQTSKPEGQNRQTFKPEDQNLQIFKPEPEDDTLKNRGRILAEILKINCNTESLKLPPALQVEETGKQIVEENKSAFMIDSVSIKLQNSVSQEQDCHPDRDTLKKKNTLEKPVSHGETESLLPVDRVNEDSEGAATVVQRISDRDMSSEECTQSKSMDSDCGENVPGGSLPFFDTAAAKEFLAKRWEEAISGEHVELDDDLCISSSVVGNAENQVGTIAQVKFNPEKGLKIKFIHLNKKQ